MAQQRPDVNDIIAFAIFVTACGAELKTARTASSNTPFVLLGTQTDLREDPVIATPEQRTGRV